MSKKIKDKLPKLPPLKKKLKGKVYVGNQIEKMKQEIDSITKQRDSLTKQRDSLTKQRDSLTKQRDSLQRKSLDQQKEIDSLKQVIKIRVK